MNHAQSSAAAMRSASGGSKPWKTGARAEQIGYAERGGDQMRGKAPAESEAAEIVVPGNEAESGGETSDAA